MFLKSCGLGLYVLVLFVLENEFLDEFNKFMLGCLDFVMGLLDDLRLLVSFCEFVNDFYMIRLV